MKALIALLIAASLLAGCGDKSPSQQESGAVSTPPLPEAEPAPPVLETRTRLVTFMGYSSHRGTPGGVVKTDVSPVFVASPILPSPTTGTQMKLSYVVDGGVLVNDRGMLLNIGGAFLKFCALPADFPL